MIYVIILAAIIALWLGALAFLRLVWFFRDPPRKPERREDGMIIAPADGRVVYIRRDRGRRTLRREARREDSAAGDHRLRDGGARGLGDRHIHVAARRPLQLLPVSIRRSRASTARRRGSTTRCWTCGSISGWSGCARWWTCSRASITWRTSATRSSSMAAGSRWRWC